MRAWKTKILRQEDRHGVKNLKARRHFNRQVELRGGAKNHRIIKDDTNAAPSLMKYRWAERAFFVRETTCKKCKKHTVLEWKSPFTNGWSSHPFPSECTNDLTKIKKAINPYTPQLNAARYVLEKYMKQNGYIWKQTNSALRKGWNATHPACQHTTKCSKGEQCKNPKQMHSNDILHNIWTQREKLMQGGAHPVTKCQQKMPTEWRLLDVFSGKTHFVDKHLRYHVDAKDVHKTFPLKAPSSQPINVIGDYKNMHGELENLYDANTSYQKAYKDRLGWVWIRGKRPDPSCMEYVHYSTWCGPNPCETGKPELSVVYQETAWSKLDMELRKRGFARVDPPKSFKGSTCKKCKKKHFIHRVQDAWDYSLQKKEPAPIADRDMHGNAQHVIDAGGVEDNLQQEGYELQQAYNELLQHWSDVLQRFYSHTPSMHSIYHKSNSVFHNLFQPSSNQSTKTLQPTVVSSERLQMDKIIMQNFQNKVVDHLKRKICAYRHKVQKVNPDSTIHATVGLPLIEKSVVTGIMVSATRSCSYQKTDTFKGMVNVKEVFQEVSKSEWKQNKQVVKETLFLEVDAISQLDCTSYQFDITGSTSGMAYKLVKEQNTAVKKQLNILHSPK